MFESPSWGAWFQCQQMVFLLVSHSVLNEKGFQENLLKKIKAFQSEIQAK